MNKIIVKKTKTDVEDKKEDQILKMEGIVK